MAKLKLYLAISCLSLIAGLPFLLNQTSNASGQAKATIAAAEESSPKKITALARLEPAGEIILVSAAGKERFDRIERLLVKAGDEIKTGQNLAFLESYRTKLLLIKEKECRVEEAKARLAQLKAGAKEGEIKAQEAVILKLEEEEKGKILEQSQIIQAIACEKAFRGSEYNRYQQLFNSGALSASELEAKRLALQTAEARLNEASLADTRLAQTYDALITEARGTLRKIKEIRTVDVKVLEAQVNEEKAQLEQAREDLRFALITAPSTGKVLKIITKEGEAIGANGLLELGDTKKMFAVAEVYQSEVNEIRQGDQAQIQGESFPFSVAGTVEEIGHKVTRQKVFSNEAGGNFDNRVVEVKIRLHCPSKLADKIANLTNSQVIATVYPQEK
jgi:HlyD family secretion protein